MSETAQLFSLDIKLVDEALDACERNQLSTFVGIVRFYMARDPISLAQFGTRDGQLKLDFTQAVEATTVSSSPVRRRQSPVKKMSKGQSSRNSAKAVGTSDKSNLSLAQ